LDIEAKIINFDILVIAQGSYDVKSSDQGIIVFLDSSMLVDNNFSLIQGTTLTRYGERSGADQGKITAVGFSNSAGQASDFVFDKASINGDSGGGYIIDVDLGGGTKGFLLGTQSASNGTSSYGNFFEKDEFDSLSDFLDDYQTGDVTSLEPTNLIVGSASADTGGGRDNSINGSFRADIILGRDGNDSLNDGDLANDTAYADDQLFGGAGDDRLIVGAGNNLIHGGDFRKYGGADRVKLADDGEDTADFGGSTNGIEIRLPALDAGDAANNGNPAIDTRYKQLLGDDFKSSLFVKSRKLQQSNEPVFTNTLVSIEKIKGSDVSDVLYLNELPTSAAAAGGISEIDFGGQDARGFPGGDLIVLGTQITTGITARLSNLEDQKLEAGSTAAALKLKNAESIIATQQDDEVFAAAGGFVIAGKGNDKIHLRAGTFAIGGEGQDEFYVKTKYDGTNVTFDNDVFILDFNPDEDKLYVDGVIFTGYNKETRYDVVAEGPNEQGYFRRYWAQNLTAGSSSFGLRGTDINVQTYLELAAGGAAYQDGNIRNINAASLYDGPSSAALGRVQFIDANIAFRQENPTRDEAEILGSWPNSSVSMLPNYTLNNFLNLHIGQFWRDGEEAFRHSYEGSPEGLDNTLDFGSGPDSHRPHLASDVAEGDDGVGSPQGVSIQELTGFDADRSSFSISSWNDSQRATVNVLLGTDLPGGLGIDPLPFASASFSSLSGSSGATDSFSFIYDGNITVTLPIDLSSMDFAGDYGRLASFDLSQDAIFAFSNTLGLREIGVLPTKSESISGALRDGRAKIAGNADELLAGTEGSDILIGGSGNNVLTAGSSNFSSYQNDLLVGGAGDDIYNVGGPFDKSAIIERLDGSDSAGGFDVLNLDFASDVVTVVEGNDPNDVRLYVSSFLLGGGEGGPNFNGIDPILTIANLRSTDSDDWIEEFRFSDGVTWTRQELLDNMHAAEDFGGISDQLGDDIFSIEDYIIFEPVSSYLYDPLRRNLTYSVAMADGTAAPDWIEIQVDTATGESWIVGNPPENFFGELDLQITGSYGSEQTTAYFRVIIDPVNDAPQIVGLLEDQVVNAGNLSVAIPVGLFADVEGDPLTISVVLADGSPLPTWLSFDGNTLSGETPAGFEGSIDFRVEASDGDLSTATYFSIYVEQNSNQSPEVLTPLADQVIAEDSTFDFLVPSGTFADPDGDTLTLTATLANGDALPSWLSFDGTRFIGTPPANFNGQFEISVAASDGVTSVADTFALTISSINDAPTAITLSPASINENSPAGAVVGTLAAFDVDASDTHNFTILEANMRLDQALLLDPAAPIGIAFTGVDAGMSNSGLRLTSMGRYAGSNGQGAYTVWRVRNSNADERTVRLNASSGLFDRTLMVPGDTDLYVLSSDVSGSATHRLYLGSTLLDTKASSSSGFSASTIISVTNPMFDIVGNQLVVRSGANLDFERLPAVSLTVQATDAVGASVVQMLNVSINDVADLNVVTGTNSNNTINGSAFGDNLRGLGGDDRLNGNGGNDLLEGGTGTDTAGFAGLRSSYQIVTQNGAVTVVDTQASVDGDDGTDTISSIERLTFRNNETINVASPIILDLDGNGIETLSASESSARYDLDGDGLSDDTSWIGRTEGFLFLDRDGNGTVSNVGEFSFIDDVAGARSDLEGLRAFDSNNDRILSALDARFGEFRIWQDLDGDGAAEGGEILTLTQAGVRSINLTATAVNGATDFGDVAIVNRGSYTRTNGTTRQFIDAALTYYSAASNVPTIAVQNLGFERRVGRYSISYANGEMTISPNRRRGEVDPRAGVLGISSQLSFANRTIGMLSPIILDLDGDGVEMRSIRRARASFDMNGDGRLDDTGWASGGDGFLVIDRNNDGLISHASELSFASEDANARSDLEALAALDSNNDGVLNVADARFGELKIWVDANGDGVTDAGELKRLEEHGITEIGLRGRNTSGTAEVGQNVLLSTSTFTRSNGSVWTLGNAALAYRPGSEPVPVVAAGENGRFTEPQLIGENEVLEGLDVNDNAASLVAALSASPRSYGVPSLFDVDAMLPEGLSPFDYFENRSNDAFAPVPEMLPGVDAVTPLANAPEQRAALVAVEADRVLSLIAQDMAAFGARGGEDELQWRRDGVRPIDFYA
jgi:hypothetical protein